MKLYKIRVMKTAAKKPQCGTFLSHYIGLTTLAIAM
jgi:hypothetical protein